MDEVSSTRPVELTVMAGLLAAAGGLSALIAQGAPAGACEMCLHRQALTPSEAPAPAATEPWSYTVMLRAGESRAGMAEFSGWLAVSAPAQTPGPARP